MDEHVSLYVTPINIDPDRPAMPISHPSVLRHVSGEADRQVRDARTGRGHLGAERRGHRRRGLSAAGLRHRPRARGHVLRRARPASRRRARLACSTRPIGSSTCSGASSRAARRREISEALRAQRRARRPGDGSAAGRTTCSWCCPTTGSRRFGAASTSTAGCARRATLCSSPERMAPASGCATWTGRAHVPTPSASPGCS